MNAGVAIGRAVTVGLAAACLLSAPAAAERWRTSEFVFEKKDPAAGVLGAIGNLGGYSAAEMKVIAGWEEYLSKVAAYYQSMGFKEPALPKTKGRNGGEAYAVYLFDYDDSESHAQFAPSPPHYLRLDLSRVFIRHQTRSSIKDELGTKVDVEPLPRMHEDLAHELFHAIQASYRGPKGAIQADWIIEGSAQAVGMEAARRLGGSDLYAGKDDYRLGGRRYFEPLATSDTQKGYRTSSLWRYIGEHVAAAKRNARAGVAPIDPDFSYLDGVFARPYDGEPSHVNDMRWLDAGLEMTTGIGLNRHYAAMVSTLSAYMPARWTSPPKKKGMSQQEREDGWRQFLFGRCDPVKLSSDTPSGSTPPLDLRMNASRCFKADVAGAGRADVSIQFRAETVGALEALFIGTEGGDRLGAAQVVPSPAGGGYIGHWRFRVEAGTPQVFIISNMADNPAHTGNLHVTPEITLSRWDSSMSTPRPQAPSRGTGSTPVKKGIGDPARAAAASEVRTALASLSNQSANGARASFRRERVACTEDFADVGCPSHTTIHLALTPGGFGDMTQTTGAGGALGQFMSKMNAIADNGIVQTDRDLNAMNMEIARTEGTSVTISFPLIEYGFTGSFDNIAIRVNGGAAHGAFEARGPADSQPGRGRKYLHSGRVTVEEFTPFVMRGRFSADLTDLSKVEFTEADQDMTLPIDRTISGSFVIAAPWEGDPKVAVYRPQTTNSGMQDLAMVFPGITPGAPTGVKAPPGGASPPGGGGSPGATSSAIGIGAFPSCDCSCQPLQTFSKPCKQICRTKLQQCWAGTASAEVRSAAQQEQSALADAIPQMRADFERHLIANGMADLKESMLAAFDSQTTVEDKRRVVMSYGMSVAKYGNDAVQRAAANPAPLPTRQAFIDDLKSQGLRQQVIDGLVADMDALMAEKGGWPK